MDVEILHVAGCRGAARAEREARRALRELGHPEVPVSMRLIDAAGAAGAAFAGSPTVLVDGEDAVPGAAPVAALACRLYRTPAGPRDHPTAEQLLPAFARRLEARPLS